MAQTEVIWTTRALNDLEAIGEYISLDAPNRAVTFTSELFNAALRLGNFPMSGQLCFEDHSCRQVIHAGYRIIYEIRHSKVLILTVRSPGQEFT